MAYTYGGFTVSSREDLQTQIAANESALKALQAINPVTEQEKYAYTRKMAKLLEEQERLAHIREKMDGQ